MNHEGYRGIVSDRVHASELIVLVPAQNQETNTQLVGILRADGDRRGAEVGADEEGLETAEVLEASSAKARQEYSVVYRPDNDWRPPGCVTELEGRSQPGKACQKSKKARERDHFETTSTYCTSVSELRSI